MTAAMTISYWKDLSGRLRSGWKWVLAQVLGNILLLLIGLAWTRIPEKHLWQVALSLLIPLLLIISVLELHAGTMRNFARRPVLNDARQVKLILGAATFLIWIAVFALGWVILNWYDSHIVLWAGFLNSRASASMRSRLFTYQHIQQTLIVIEWILRWIALPAKLIPFAVLSAQSGWRIPVRSAIRLLWNWRWWLGVVVASLLAVLVPHLLFAKLPSGTVNAQIWAVSLKLAASYLLAVGSWVLLLAWAAVLFDRQQRPPDSSTDLIPALIGPPDAGNQAAIKLPLPEDS